MKAVHYAPADWMAGVRTALQFWCLQPWRGGGRVVHLDSHTEKVTCLRCKKRLSKATR